MLAVVIIGILVSIGVAQFSKLITKSNESSTRGNLASLRSALSIYYADNNQVYPSDGLSSLTAGNRYIPLIPLARVPPYHDKSQNVLAEATPTETGGWSYDNDETTVEWGQVRVGCLHVDSRGSVWTEY